MKNKHLFSVILTAVALTATLFLTGCKSGGANRLEPGGAYATTGTAADYTFYSIDSAFSVAYASLDAVFNFERDNREALWKISPDIKHTLDKLRPAAWLAVQQYSHARAAYLAAQAGGGAGDLAQMKDALGKIESMAAEVNKTLPK